MVLYDSWTVPFLAPLDEFLARWKVALEKRGIESKEGRVFDLAVRGEGAWGWVRLEPNDGGILVWAKVRSLPSRRSEEVLLSVIRESSKDVVESLQRLGKTPRSS